MIAQSLPQSPHSLLTAIDILFDNDDSWDISEGEDSVHYGGANDPLKITGTTSSSLEDIFSIDVATTTDFLKSLGSLPKRSSDRFDSFKRYLSPRADSSPLFRPESPRLGAHGRNRSDRLEFSRTRSCYLNECGGGSSIKLTGGRHHSRDAMLPVLYGSMYHDGSRQNLLYQAIAGHGTAGAWTFSDATAVRVLLNNHSGSPPTRHHLTKKNREKAAISLSESRISPPPGEEKLGRFEGDSGHVAIPIADEAIHGNFKSRSSAFSLNEGFSSLKFTRDLNISSFPDSDRTLLAMMNGGNMLWKQFRKGKKNMPMVPRNGVSYAQLMIPSRFAYNILLETSYAHGLTEKQLGDIIHDRGCCSAFAIPMTPVPRGRKTRDPINCIFHSKYPWIHKSVTLSKMQNLKHDLFGLLQKCPSLDPSTAAIAWVYFERLLALKIVHKSNRKQLLGACVLLAFKFNQSLRPSIAQKELLVAIQTLDSRDHLTQVDILAVEFRVFALLDFGLQVYYYDVAAHLEEYFELHPEKTFEMEYGCGPTAFLDNKPDRL